MEAIKNTVRYTVEEYNRMHKACLDVGLIQDTPKHEAFPDEIRTETGEALKIKSTLLDIWKIRSASDEEWSEEEANALMKKWIGPKHLWNERERYIFLEDESLTDVCSVLGAGKDQQKIVDIIMPFRDTNKSPLINGWSADVYQKKLAEDLADISLVLDLPSDDERENVDDVKMDAEGSGNLEVDDESQDVEVVDEGEVKNQILMCEAEVKRWMANSVEEEAMIVEVMSSKREVKMVTGRNILPTF